jgi:hypothetical protein
MKYSVIYFSEFCTRICPKLRLKLYNTLDSTALNIFYIDLHFFNFVINGVQKYQQFLEEYLLLVLLGYV